MWFRHTAHFPDRDRAWGGSSSACASTVHSGHWHHWRGTTMPLNTQLSIHRASYDAQKLYGSMGPHHRVHPCHDGQPSRIWLHLQLDFHQPLMHHHIESSRVLTAGVSLRGQVGFLQKSCFVVSRDMFEKKLIDLVKGIRSHKQNTDAYISSALEEIRRELKSRESKIKVNAISKLAYVSF